MESTLITLVATLVSISLVFLAYDKLLRPRYKFRGKHVLITGGTKGLGAALAKSLAVDHQASVTICARTPADVAATAKEIREAIQLRSAAHVGRIQGFPCDVANPESVAKLIESAEESFGNISVLICCAGTSLTGEFLERGFDDYKKQIELNYYGSLLPTHTVVKNMISRHQKDGKILFIASQAALMSLIGYAAYSPSKFAVRGLAETLRHELLPHSIGVHIAFLGNMKSPGYEIEQRTKPEVTKRIEAGEPLQEPEVTAAAVIDSLAKGEYAIYGGNFSGYMLGRMSRGLAPHGNYLLLDMILAPILVVAAFGHRVFILDRAHS